MRRIELPNIRELFVPDPDHVIFDADLQGADAQVVAWEADEADMKEAFRKGWKIHAMNAEMMWGSRYTNAPGDTDSGVKGKMYKDIKQGVHLTNYGGSARTCATVLGWTVKEAEWFQNRWFSIRPGIKRWHNRTMRQLEATSSVTNKFGFTKTFFDRPDSNFTKALAWVPQSSVAVTCFKGAIRTRKAFAPKIKWLLQVHDSLLFSLHKRDLGLVPDILKSLHVPVPYDDLLTIPWDVKWSDVSWGKVSTKVPLVDLLQGAQ